VEERVKVKERHCVYIVLHWAITLDVLILIFTGFYIYSPFFGGYEAAMAWTRFVHFTCGAILIEITLLRVSLAFLSEFDADWLKAGPTWRNLKLLPDYLAYMFFFRSKHRYYGKFTPWEAVIYGLVWPLLVGVMAVTGFGILHGPFMFTSIRSEQLFGWVPVLLGSDAQVRLVHTLGMWLFIATGLLHLYLVIIQTLEERDLTFTSIFDGRRLVPRKYAREHEGQMVHADPKDLP